MAKKTKTPSNTDGITKGMATGKAPEKVSDATTLAQVVNQRKCIKLSSYDTCIDYLAEYCQWADDHPLLVYELMKAGTMAGTQVALTKKRAVSLGAFCLFIGQTVAEFKKDMTLLAKEDGDPALLKGYEMIVDTLHAMMDESALAGQVDANYMSKLRGLRDLKDVTSNGKETGTKAMQVNVLSEEAVNNLKKLGGI